MHPFAELDDIGFVGIPGHTPSQEDRVFFAQKGEEARERYRAKLESESRNYVLFERETAPFKQVAYA